MRLLFSLPFAVLFAITQAQATSVPPPTGEVPDWKADPVVETAPGRGGMVLNGLWRFQPANPARLDAATLPDDWGWIRVPGVWADLREWPRWGMPGVVAAAPAWKAADYNTVFAAWHEREITIPTDWAGRAVVLQLERVSTDATVFVDGSRAGEIRWPSGEVDLTALVQAGRTHRLSLLVQSTPQAGEVLTLMDFNDASAAKAKLKSRGVIDDVRLVSRPRGARIDGVFVRTSVRERRLAADVELVGWPVGEAVATVSARVLEWPSGAVVAELPSRTLPVADAVVRPSWDWIAPKLWDVGRPNLYTLELSLLRDEPAPAKSFLERLIGGKKSGVPKYTAFDTWRERFGFREFRIEGRGFLLNERPLRLRPFYQHNDNTISGLAEAVDAQVVGLLENGFNFWEMWPRNWNLRGEVQFNRLWADAADERGLTMSLPFAHPAGWMGGDMWNNRPIPEAAFVAWEKAMRDDWKKYRNHPSVVMWIGYANMFSHGDDQNPRRLGQRPDLLANGDYGTRPRIAAGMRLIDTVKALDPTRPATTHHGGPIGDFQTVNHYLNLMPLQEREEHPSEWARDGDVPFMSIEFGVPFSLTFTRGRNGYGNAAITEPLVTEHAASYLGPKAYALETPAYRANLARRFKSDQTYDNVDNSATIFGHDTFQAVAELFIRNTWRSWRMWGVTGGMIPWSGGYSWRTEEGDVAIPAFQPGRSGTWFPSYKKNALYLGPAGTGELTPAGRTLIEVNGPTLAWIAGPAPRAEDSGAFTAKDSRFYAGATVEKSVALANDLRDPQSYTGEIVATLGGVELARREISGNLAVGENRFEPFTFVVPAVKSRRDGVITLRARIGERVHEDSFVWRAYPVPAEPSSPSATLWIWDPEGATTALLTVLGQKTKGIDLLSEARFLPPGTPLVIGRRALDSLAPAARHALNDILLAHSRTGATVLVFAQSPETLRDDGYRVSRFVSRRFWPVSTQTAHPALAGLDAGDFQDWAGTGDLVSALDAPLPSTEGTAFRAPTFGYRWGTRGSVSSAAVEKPHRSGWTPLLEGEFDLAYSPLQELRVGAGRLLWCQLDIEGRAVTEPAARRVVENLLQIANSGAKPDPQHSGPVGLSTSSGPACYVGGPEGSDLLQSLGVIFTSVSRIEPAAPLAIIGADVTLEEPTLRAYLRGGGRVVFLPRPAGPQVLGVSLRESVAGALTTDELPPWRELQGLSISDLRLRVDIRRPVAFAEAGAEVAAGGLVARVVEGAGSALWIQTAPSSLPADTKTFYRYSQWRWTRALSQVLANAGATFALDAKPFRGPTEDTNRPLPLAGSWRAQFERRVAENTPDAGNQGREQGWQKPEFDASAWRPITVPGFFEAQVPDWSEFDGAIWYRREFTLPETWNGKDLWLNLGVVDDEDTTYINGRQIGRTAGDKSWSEKRRYRVPAWALKPGVNSLAVRVYDIRGNGGFAEAREEQINLELVDKIAAEAESYYVPGFRLDHELGDDPARYYRW